ncbi:MAG: phasin family protein [Methyloceanibacter sp.]|jgi:hypothetical protein
MIEFDKAAFDKAAKDIQKLGKDNYEAVLKSYGQVNQGIQEIGTSLSDYAKQAFADANVTFEKLVGAKTLEHAVEIQSQYAKVAYDKWMAEMTKVGEMYATVARDAYKPVEKAVEKTAATVTAS